MRGLTSHQIAADLVISPDTVKGHRKTLYRKLGVHTQAEAADAGRRLGITTGPECPR